MEPLFVPGTCINKVGEGVWQSGRAALPAWQGFCFKNNDAQETVSMFSGPIYLQALTVGVAETSFYEGSDTMSASISSSVRTGIPHCIHMSVSRVCFAFSQYPGSHFECNAVCSTSVQKQPAITTVLLCNWGHAACMHPPLAWHTPHL